MNLQFVKYFIVLSATENFTKGAAQVHVVQSTFSSGIKKLEDHLGVKLFERNNRNVKLTKHGLYFLPRAKELLNKWQAIEEDFDVVNFESLRIGFVQNISINDVLHYVNDYKKDNGLFQIDILEEKENSLSKLLEADEIHAYFSDGDKTPAHFEKITVATEKLYFAAHQNHVLANKKSVDLKDLENEPFIERVHCVLHKEVFDELNKQNISIKKPITAHNNETVIGLVASGIGITLMPKPVFSVPEVVFIPIKDIAFSRAISLVWKNDYRKKELNKFIALVKENRVLIS